ncbi:aromatic acid exporter family protein [Allobacillus sp. GCM10007491]|uniref:Aromatic acid exporter family protein n=1 Tax=Allobacillus saliphilus TaxID=2912308 RepID=A0A941HTI6_9BACI|nr:aromatic acid exporter family protein [Allobacillus saliphilus]MBR7554468.1 aromatic acid exporter family protein [Allobacillus saliphilus]
MKLGARAFKTGVAIMITMYIATLIGFEAGFFAGTIAAATSLQPSIYRSFQTMAEQIQANILGSGIAIIIVLTAGNAPFLIGIGIVVVIGICTFFKMKEDTTFIAIIALLALMMYSADVVYLEFAGIRFTTILIGIFSAFLVNLAFLPPKYEIQLFNQISELTSDLLQWIRVTTRHLADQPALKKEIETLNTELWQLENTYLLFSEERTYSRSRGIERARKLVIFRSLISLSRKSYDLLTTLHRLDYDIEHISKDISRRILKEVDKVMHTHEKLMLMYQGRIRSKDTDPLHSVSTPDVKGLIVELINYYDEGDEEARLKLIPLASMLYDYHEEMMHCKMLMKSYLKKASDHELY